MSLTIHLSQGTTHITLLEAPDTTVKQLLAEVADVLTDTGVVVDIHELKKLQIGLLYQGQWRDITQEPKSSLEQLGIDEKTVLGFTTTGEFAYTPIADVDIE